jgi:type II secretion system protein N
MKFERPRLTTVLAGIGLFLLFLVFLFPFQNLKGYVFGQIYRNTGIVITAEELYLSLFGWPGVGMTGVDVAIPMGRGEMEVSARKVVARVGLGSLFPPVPSFSLDMSDLKGGGDLYVKVTRGKNFIKGSVEADAVVLNQLRFSNLPQPVEGIATIDGDFYFDEDQLPKSTGKLDLRIDKFRFPALNLQGFVLPSFDLNPVVAQIQIRNGNIEIARSQLGQPGGDFQGKLAGELRLARTFLESYLNLTVYIQLSQRYIQDPNSATVVSFLGGYQRAPGDYAMRWSSTIQGMMTNLLNALPQKALN